jgi:hypothetical protein
MIVLARNGDTVRMTPLLWESLRVVAERNGWEPAGAVPRQDGAVGGEYGQGSSVEGGDAGRLAAALERFVNGEAADGGALDLAALVRLINFLRGGGFEIR